MSYPNLRTTPSAVSFFRRRCRVPAMNGRKWMTWRQRSVAQRCFGFSTPFQKCFSSIRTSILKCNRDVQISRCFTLICRQKAVLDGRLTSGMNKTTVLPLSLSL